MPRYGREEITLRTTQAASRSFTQVLYYLMLAGVLSMSPCQPEKGMKKTAAAARSVVMAAMPSVVTPDLFPFSAPFKWPEYEEMPRDP